MPGQRWARPQDGGFSGRAGGLVVPKTNPAGGTHGLARVAGAPQSFKDVIPMGMFGFSLPASVHRSPRALGGGVGRAHHRVNISG